MIGKNIWLWLKRAFRALRIRNSEWVAIMSGWKKSPRTFLVVTGVLFCLALTPTIGGCTVGQKSKSAFSRVMEVVEDSLRPLPPQAKREFQRFAEIYRKYATDPKKERLDYFGFAYKRVRTKYVRNVSDRQLINFSIEGVEGLKGELNSIKPKTLIEAALDKMVTSLDPHSSFMSKEEFKESFVQTKGEFGGLGIEVTKQDGLVKIVAPIENTPAEKAGVVSGDLITHVDGKSLEGLSLSQSVRRMRGSPGSVIRLTIKRKGKAQFDVTMIRAIITVRAVRWRTIGRIGYIRVSRFSERVETGVVKAFAAIRNELGGEPTGIILDLRNNPGGLLDQSVILSDFFLDGGEIVSVRGRDKESDRIFNADGGDLAQGLPMIVLINGGSASASEIVASALKYHDRATIMGTPSFGKGSVQTIIPMPEEGALRLTTALYYGPDNKTIQALGVKPEIQIVSGLKPKTLRRESDLPGFLPAQKKQAIEEMVTISDETCPAIPNPRKKVVTGKNVDRMLGCAVAYFKFGSKQSFLAAYGRANRM